MAATRDTTEELARRSRSSQRSSPCAVAKLCVLRGKEGALVRGDMLAISVVSRSNLSRRHRTRHRSAWRRVQQQRRCSRSVIQACQPTLVRAVRAESLRSRALHRRGRYGCCRATVTSRRHMARGHERREIGATGRCTGSIFASRLQFGRGVAGGGAARAGPARWKRGGTSARGGSGGGLSVTSVCTMPAGTRTLESERLLRSCPCVRPLPWCRPSFCVCVPTLAASLMSGSSERT